MIYVSRDIDTLYLSHESFLALRILPLDFPTIGSMNRHRDNVDNVSIAAVRALNAGCSDVANHNGGCDCPEWEDPPQHPKALPFPCTPGNNAMMREWLRNRYASSTFNTCPHRPLPAMAGPPVEIHLDESAVPRACQTAAPIPVHWQDRVYRDLLRDKALGVIERFPYGEQTAWWSHVSMMAPPADCGSFAVDQSLPQGDFCHRVPISPHPPGPE